MVVDEKYGSCKEEGGLYDEPDADAAMFSTTVKLCNANEIDSAEELGPMFHPSLATISMHVGSSKLDTETSNTFLDSDNTSANREHSIFNGDLEKLQGYKGEVRVSPPTTITGVKCLISEYESFDIKMNWHDSQSDEDFFVPTAKQIPKKKSSATSSMNDDGSFHVNSETDDFDNESMFEDEVYEDPNEIRLIKLEKENAVLANQVYGLEVLLGAYRRIAARVLAQK